MDINDKKRMPLDSDSSVQYGTPLAGSNVMTGFPSPADDYMESGLDFNKYLVKHPAATFCVRISGDSMIDAGIYPDDLLVVDRSLNPKNNSVVIAALNGELTVRSIEYRGNDILLVSANARYKPVLVRPEMNFELWGVVSHVIRKI